MKTTTIAHKKTVTKLRELAQLEWDDEAINNRVQKGSENIFVRDMIKQEYAGSKREIEINIPEIAFTREIKIELGDNPCIINHVGGDHSPDSTIVFIPNENVVFIGDSIYPNPYRNGEYTFQNLFPLIDKLLGYDADLYIDSHDNPMTKKLFQQKCRRLQEVGSLTRKYQDQKTEIIEELKNKAQIEGLTIDQSWCDEIDYVINAFQAGLEI
jgi:glyoxylase-like metal-dependent hydrolase (beta-lactamase superfamily II)